MLRMVQYFMLLPLHLLMGLACWLLSPILPLAAIGRETLPAWLSWFQTPDAPLDGDSGFAKLYPPGKWPRYVRRVLWLIRNPAYGFAWSVLAYDPTAFSYHWRGSLTPATQKGLGWWFIWQDDGHFEFSTRIESLPGRLFYFRFGWKIIGLATGGNTGRQKFVFTLNPIDPI
ncbi:MAG: DUF7338 family protein [Aeromonadaceae bacterium]